MPRGNGTWGLYMLFEIANGTELLTILKYNIFPATLHNTQRGCLSQTI